MNRKKSLSFNSICLTKKKKFKIKSKSKIITYKSSNELIKSNSGSRSRLYIGEIYSGNNSNENLSNNLLNMDKKCHYTIRKYVNNNQIISNETMINNDEDNEATQKQTTLNINKKVR